jgi:uncharacterized cupin superfamily protein
MQIRKLDTSPATPDEYYLPAEKLLTGNPKQTVWIQYQDSSGKFFVGIWASEVGKWKVQYTEEEYCRMLEGQSVLTDTAGHSVTVSAGESFVVPRGFVGTWEVVVPTRKVFVVYESGAGSTSVVGC